jgi:hypothetical protein
LDGEFADRLKLLVGDKPITIYGLGNIGKVLVEILKERHMVLAILDKGKSGKYRDIDILKPSEASENVKKSVVLLTVMYDKAELENFLREHGFVEDILDIRDMVK